MTSKRASILAAAMLLAGASAVFAVDPQRWIHVHVDEQTFGHHETGFGLVWLGDDPSVTQQALNLRAGEIRES